MRATGVLNKIHYHWGQAATKSNIRNRGFCVNPTALSFKLFSKKKTILDAVSQDSDSTSLAGKNL